MSVYHFAINYFSANVSLSFGQHDSTSSRAGLRTLIPAGISSAYSCKSRETRRMCGMFCNGIEYSVIISHHRGSQTTPLSPGRARESFAHAPVSGGVFAHDAVEPRHEAGLNDGQLAGLLSELVVGLVKLRAVEGALQPGLHGRHVAEWVRLHVFAKVSFTGY